MTKRTTGSMLKIGDVAERAGVSLRTLRHYDTIGLLPPSGRSEGGFRLYTEADYRRLETSQGLKALGWSLEQITEVLYTLTELEVPQTQARRFALLRDLSAHTDQADQQRKKLAEGLRRADRLIETLRQRRAHAPEAA
ncbi:MerR family transcriptional regulator [Kocuria rosea]|uniref:MerR family transcriptional regulator n=1 Tax=Kocuria rosea TaxID=1275 RepID=UPI00203C1CA6|nr:MerR family transcriptional regulator [Kocuria rosea]